MDNRPAEYPFVFVGCWELREMLARSARDERQLLEAIEEVPLDSIYYHTHSFLLRHKYIAGPYPNDFATWAAIQVRDRVLGEKLGILSPYDFQNLESLRAEVATIVLQKSLREGFGLTVAEAMWKGKPVIGGFTGGITVQLVYRVTGFTVNSVEGTAFRIHYLLDNPEAMARMGQDAREFVRRNFLITRHLGDYLALMSYMGR